MKPKISVIILNYNGKTVIKKTIDSLLAQNYPQDKFEIIVIDNHSHDKSMLIVKKYAKKTSNIKYKILRQNLGFSKGNNVGIKLAKGKYVVLLNNDCIVDKNWLTQLEKTTKSDPKIFSVNSKILLYPKFFTLTLKNTSHLTFSKAYLSESKYLSYNSNKKIGPLLVYEERNLHFIDIPYLPNDNKISITLKTSSRQNSQLKLSNTNLNSKTSKLRTIKNSNKIKITINIDDYIKKISFDKIQNAGSFVFQDGYSRDIGSYVNYYRQEYERDHGQYSKIRQVYSTCGAAVLYNRSILKKIGNLNENFFMYYEDTEISERARLSGFKNIYCPTAIVRHLHALSSHEWSNFFVFHVEKGRLMHLFYNFPVSVFIKQFFLFFIKSILRSIKNINSSKNIVYFRVLLSLSIQLPKLIYSKIKYSKQFVPHAIKKNYSKILSGYWYSN